MSESSGLLESLQRMVGTLIAIGQSRLELLSNEMEEERLRVEQMLLYCSIALFFFGLSIMLLTVFIVVLFWDSHRLLILGGLSALFALAGLMVWGVLRRVARSRTKLFSASLAELSNDQDSLASRS